MAYKEINIQNKLKPLIEECRNSWVEPEYRNEWSDEDILGMIVSKYCRWQGDKIGKVAVEAFTDSNYHDVASQIEKTLGE